MDLSAYISERIASGQKLLAPYLCAGFPDPGATLPLLEALADAGADFIELGVPFSDPLADGPVLQASSQRALRAGMTLEKTLAMAREFHQTRSNVPLVMMGYVNPILAMGREAFAKKACDAGISGLLIPDLPPENWALIQAPGIPSLIPFAAPNTPDSRLEKLGKIHPPFLYAVSVLGVTGAREGLGKEVAPFLARAKKFSNLPVLAGFGVSQAEQIPTLAKVCDGVILGSSLAMALEGVAFSDLPLVAKAFLAPFREALDSVGASCC